MASTGSRPTILIVSLSKILSWPEQHAAFVQQLSSKANVRQAASLQAITEIMEEGKLSAIILADPDLCTQARRYADTHKKLVDFVSQGGTLVMAGYWSSFVKPDDADSWFSTTWGLPWLYGDYHRTTVHLSSDAPCLDNLHRDLYAKYSLKATFLQNVSNEDGLYWPTSTSRVESMVFDPTAVSTDQCPVVLKKIGQGNLGYIGDVNDEDGSRQVLLGMCGLE